MDFVRFDQSDIANIIAQMKPEDVDKLAFGAVQVDMQGTILMFNAAEGEITGRKSSEVVGQNFFNDVAPCTKSPEFYGRFINSENDPNFSTMFEYVFDYQMKPTKVKVHMKKGFDGKSVWIFIKRL